MIKTTGSKQTRQINGSSLNNTRPEARRHFRKKKWDNLKQRD
jgi:hypothetical protein